MIEKLNKTNPININDNVDKMQTNNVKNTTIQKLQGANMEKQE